MPPWKLQIGSVHQNTNLNWTSRFDANHKECHANQSLKLRQYGCKQSHVTHFFQLTLLFLLPLSPSEKKWFTDEPENAYPRNIQIKPMSTHMANQVNQYKSTSSLIPPIREVEDECWTPGFLADSPDICALFQRRWGRHHHWRSDDIDDDNDDDGGVEDWHISLHSFF